MILLMLNYFKFNCVAIGVAKNLVTFNRVYRCQKP